MIDETKELRKTDTPAPDGAGTGCDIGEVIDEVLRLVWTQIVFYTIDLQTDLKRGLPRTSVDRKALQTVLMGCVNHAVTSLWSVKVERTLGVTSRRCLAEDKSGPQAFAGQDGLLVRVRDNGVRMEDRARALWLESLSGRTDMEALGGRILIEKEGESGNLVTIFIPIRESERVSVGARRLKIMVVDDDPQVLMLVGQMLRKKGHEVFTCDNGYQVLINLSRSDHDLIFLDLNMPGINGPMVFGAISQDLPQYVHRIIIMSGEPERYQQFLEENNLTYIAKPFSPESFYEALDRKITFLGESPFLPRVLLLDNSSTFANVLEGLLRKRGYHVEKLDNGYAGLLKIQTSPFDLVFLDLELPGVDGPALFTTVSREFPHLIDRFIAVTASPEKHREFFETSGLVCLNKPFRPDDVYRAIDEKLSTKTDRNLGPRVLIAEDSVTVANVMEGLLRKRGVRRVEKVTNGYQSLLRLRESKYDLVLMDLNMPENDGNLVIRSVACENPDRLAHFIVVSGCLEPHKEYLDKMGVVYMSKPVEAQKFYAVVEAKLASLNIRF